MENVLGSIFRQLTQNIMHGLYTNTYANFLAWDIRKSTRKICVGLYL